MKNLLLCCLLALLLAPGAGATASAATDTPATATPPASACRDAHFALKDLSAKDLAAWLERAGAETFAPAPAVRMSIPACPDIQPCTAPCQPGEGPCFLKPLGSSECCSGDKCFRCEAGTEILVVTCPCLGAGCPRRSLELECG